MSAIKARETDLTTIPFYITSSDIGGGKRGLDVSAVYTPTVMIMHNIVNSWNPSVNLIPRLSNNAVQLFAATAGVIKRIQTIEDVGEFIALYLDAARTSLICILPLAGGQVDVSIATGVAVYIGALRDADIVSDTLFNAHFLG